MTPPKNQKIRAFGIDSRKDINSITERRGNAQKVKKLVNKFPDATVSVIRGWLKKTNTH